MSPSLQTMGFFMSDINFCNTKEQLNHLGEVVTGKVDGSPTGADIDTSTLPYTGQVRKTLPALESEYEQSITDKEAEADAAIDEYRLTNKGDYALGITLENKFEFITYNGESYFATNPPYTTTPTAPDMDGNLFVGGYTTLENVTDTIGNQNLLSNHNFLKPSPDGITRPSSTPTDYVAGTQIFSGVFVNSDVVGLTYINGRVKWINATGAIYLSVANSGALEYITEFTASVADFDGKPRTRGVSFALVGNEYRVTVGVDALEDSSGNATPLGSVKLEQGDVATWHEAGSLSTFNLADYTDLVFDSVADMTSSTEKKIKQGKVGRTSGYYSQGDGGGAEYLNRGPQPSLTPNNVTTFNDVDGNFLQIVNTGSIDVLQAGLVLNTQDNSSRIQTLHDWIAENGGGKITGSIGRKNDSYQQSPLNPDRFLLGSKVHFDSEKVDIVCDCIFGPFGSMSDHLFDISISRDQNYQFFEGAEWLWPRVATVRLFVDGRNSSLTANQCKAYKVRRICHSTLTLFEEYCIGGATWITDTIESDFNLTSRLSGEDTSDYIQHNGAVYCCIKNNSSSAVTEPGLGASWREVWSLTARTPSSEPLWVTSTSYVDGEIGAPVWIVDEPGVWDGNNNLRFRNFNIAYPKGALMRIVSRDKAFGTRNIFFYGPQLHRQDDTQTGSEGAGQSNYPGANHSPAAAGPIPEGVGVVMEWCSNVQMIGGNIRAGKKGGGLLFRMGDSNSLRPVKNIGFPFSRISGEGDNLTCFDFQAVQADNTQPGVNLSSCEINVDSGVDSRLYTGSKETVAFSVLNRLDINALGALTELAMLIKNEGDASSRFNIANNGQHRWGDGTNPTDVFLERSAAGALFVPNGVIGGENGISVGNAGYFPGEEGQGTPIACYYVGGAAGGLRGYVNVYATKG